MQDVIWQKYPKILTTYWTGLSQILFSVVHEPLHNVICISPKFCSVLKKIASSLLVLRCSDTKNKPE